MIVTTGGRQGVVCGRPCFIDCGRDLLLLSPFNTMPARPNNPQHDALAHSWHLRAFSYAN